MSGNERDSIYSNITETVGKTPLVRLAKLVKDLGCQAEIIAKLEFFNPLSSVKDRIGVSMIDYLEKSGSIKPGGTLIEPTSGNTGIALAFVAASRGYKLILTMPESMSLERRKMLRLLGAKLELTDPLKGMKGAVQRAEELLSEIPNAVIPQQFENPCNPEIHMKTTAEEIWKQTAGTIDGFTCAVGTGGTLAGVSIGLKNKNKDIKIALSDPMGSSLYSHIKNNKLESKGSSITEGIGTGRITQNFDKALIDDAFQTDDIEALNLVYDLIEKQKIVLGGSSGINIAGAIKLAKQMGPGNTIVTILCDHGRRYASKIFNKDFLKSKNLPIPSWL